MGGIDVDSVPPRTPLPRFLKPWQSPHGFGTRASVPVHAVYEHKRPFGNAQVLWWPPVTRTRTRDSAPVVPHTVLLFIPGNPGLLDFYVPFLNAIHRETVSESSDSNASPSSSSVTTIFAHAHLGLSSYLDTDGSSSSFPETSSVSLPAQVEAHLEFLDELLVAYGGHRDSDPATRVLLVGHSIGAWFVQELLKARAAHWQLRSRVLLGAFLLFPTISNIGQSPCGRTLSPLFRPPWPRTLAHLSLLIRHLPLCILRIFQPSWPTNQLQVLRRLLRAPAAIYAALTMAHDEMERVRELDRGFLREFAENVWFCYAEEDGWVGGERGVVMRAVGGTAAEGRVVCGRGSVPHAFCINHSTEVASQCVEWMRTGGFLGDVEA